MATALLTNIEKEYKSRNITRLCHFTRSKVALHILQSEEGIKAVDFLSEDICEKNDYERYDGRTDCVNCSIQYPNYWYYNRIKDKDPLFRDWVVLLIKPEILVLDTTRFCFTNAAYRSGRYIKGGVDAFNDLFAQQVYGKYARNRTRNMLPCCPTDDQAEVLVYKNISRSDIIGVAVKDEEQAHREKVRWKVGLNGFDIKVIIAPDMFNGSYSMKVRNGQVPIEYEYKGEKDNE